jgi:hypothetical protein
MTAPDRNSFVRAVLDLYLGLPDTAARRSSRSDINLARQLFNRGVAFEIVSAAMLLASAGRFARTNTAPSPPPVRSLHYFLPVIDELLASRESPDYLRHIHLRFGHLLRRRCRQIPTDSDGR